MMVYVSWFGCWTISAGSGSSSDSSTATGDAAVGDTGRGEDVGEGAVGDTGVGDAGIGDDGGGESGTATESYSCSDVNSAHAAQPVDFNAVCNCGTVSFLRDTCGFKARLLNLVFLCVINI